MNVVQLPNQIVGLLDILKLNPAKLLGKGGEGYIFEYPDNKVIKIYPKANVDYLQKLQSFQNLLQKYSLPYSIPQILKIERINNTYYTIDNKLNGRQLDTVFPELNDEQKYKALKNYFEALIPFNSIELTEYPFGQILEIQNAIRTNSWSEFLIKKLEQKLNKSSSYLPKDIKDYNGKVKLFKDLIIQNCDTPNKNLIHCDYYLNNVLVNKNLEISAVLDFSIHTAVGDRKLDILISKENDKSVDIDIYNNRKQESGILTAVLLSFINNDEFDTTNPYLNFTRLEVLFIWVNPFSPYPTSNIIFCSYKRIIKSAPPTVLS